MTEKWQKLVPHLVSGGGIIASALVAVLAAPHGSWVLSAPLCLALTTIGAAWIDFRRHGETGRLGSAVILAASFVLASSIVALRDPRSVVLFLPLLGSIAWLPLLRQSRRGCRALGGK